MIRYFPEDLCPACETRLSNNGLICEHCEAELKRLESEQNDIHRNTKTE